MPGSKVMNTADWISLSLTPGLGVTGLWRLINHFKSPGAVLAASRKQLLQIPGIRESQIAGFFSGDNGHRGAEELQRLKVRGGSAISYENPLYPKQLKELADPPPVLYILGDPHLLVTPSVAIVGSRAATAYGRRVSFSLAENLALRGLTVVSGLALGVDAESHRGALHGRGKTVAVLGCGVDIVYPRQNQSLYNNIIKAGLLVSEYPLGTKPDGFRFPARNRIISGLSSGVVVVEAAKKSGSLITAQIGLDIGREVFAVPGQVDSFKSEGTHWLLQQGAKLVQNVDDILVELEHLDLSSQVHEPKSEENDFEIDPDALALLELIEPYPQLRDTLIEISGKSPARVSELLLFLELEGLVEMLLGDQVRKI